MAVPHASLKVYEPIDAFDPSEHVQLLASTSVASRPSSLVLSRAHGLDRAAATDRSDVIVEAGVRYVCPHRSRLRLLAALVSFLRQIPPEVAGAFMPDGEAERAIRELEAIRSEHPDWRSHILTSTWEVPVRWFVPFADDERELDPVVPRLRYRTTMALARARTERALAASRSALVGSNVAALVSEMAEWFDRFDEDAIVELDYGDLAALIDPGDLKRDHSASDLGIAVTALGEGDVLRATTYYMRAAERWAPLSGLERNN